MFEKKLAATFQAIFNLKKVTYDFPGDSQEQECLFVEIENSIDSIHDGRAVCRVTGNATVYGLAEKMPFGFFGKAIQQANVALTKDLFFFDFEKNTLRYRNKVERGFSFIYFFDGQYDPELGTIQTVEFTEEIT